MFDDLAEAVQDLELESVEAERTDDLPDEQD